MFGQMAGHKFGRLTVLRKVLDPRRGRTTECQRCYKARKEAGE